MAHDKRFFKKVKMVSFKPSLYGKAVWIDGGNNHAIPTGAYVIANVEVDRLDLVGALYGATSTVTVLKDYFESPDFHMEILETPKEGGES